MELYYEARELIDRGECTREEVLPNKLQLAEQFARENETTVEDEILTLLCEN